jgi:hypothetical protein
MDSTRVYAETLPYHTPDGDPEEGLLSLDDRLLDTVRANLIQVIYSRAIEDGVDQETVSSFFKHIFGKDFDYEDGSAMDFSVALSFGVGYLLQNHLINFPPHIITAHKKYLDEQQCGAGVMDDPNE